ncbi:hypothetical protein [Modicisalibacter sp. 'Wilcox']|uniref:hypothetical protein n=1 Tax=Modicisalibacter sp. 'Wilcox' TaxID=2679914 RepID=UPI0013D2B260|nr:hypothetical protein [Modicisalibacter sp. 'Wilcox']
MMTVKNVVDIVTSTFVASTILWREVQHSARKEETTMCYSEDSLEWLEVWYVIECELELLREAAEAEAEVPEAA